MADFAVVRLSEKFRHKEIAAVDHSILEFCAASEALFSRRDADWRHPGRARYPDSTESLALVLSTLRCGAAPLQHSNRSFGEALIVEHSHGLFSRRDADWMHPGRVRYPKKGSD